MNYNICDDKEKIKIGKWTIIFLNNKDELEFFYDEKNKKMILIDAQEKTNLHCACYLNKNDDLEIIPSWAVNFIFSDNNTLYIKRSNID